MARTDERPLTTAPPGPAVPASPRARRLRGPRWLDLRVVLGVVLVLGSVLLGARVVASSDRTTGVWSVRTDLAAGTPLRATDLVSVQVRLDDAGPRYLAAATSPAGRVLTRDVSAGELLPAAAVATGSASDYVTFSLAVPAQRVPLTLTRGQRITVYASTPQTFGATGQPVQTRQVVTGVAVVEVSGRGSGALSVGSSVLQVVLSLPSCQVTALVDGTEGRTVSVAVLDAGAPAPADPCGTPAGSPSDPSSAGAGPSAPPTSTPPTSTPPAGPTAAPSS